MIPRHNRAKRVAFQATGELYHKKYTPRRFTTSHARAAGYRKRKGEDLAFGTKAYWKSYMGRKRRRGHQLPLVWSGVTRRRARSANITVTNNAVRVRYRLNVLNFHPDLRLEFLKILPAEAISLGQVFDREYQRDFRKRS
jgi:hypothetical protein